MGAGQYWRRSLLLLTIPVVARIPEAICEQQESTATVGR